MFPLWAEQLLDKKLFCSPSRKKRPSTELEKALEAKLHALEKRFKNFASSGQILESPAPHGAKASSSTPDYYMFGASREVVSSAAVTRARSVL